MTWIKKKLYLVAIPISLALSTVSAFSVRANSATEFLSGQQNITSKISQVFKTPDRGEPETTAGGATRGGCAEKERRLIALMPKEKFGLTLEEHPTFFWHISKSKAKTAEFLLLDDDDDLIYETTFNLPQEQGIFAFTLPNDAPKLEINEQYHWYLSVDCSSEKTLDIITVEGWIERTIPNDYVKSKLNNLAPKYHSKVYADAGIWHEAITHLAQQRCIYPNDINLVLYWNKLLSSVGLSEVASESMNYSCKVKT